MSTFYTLQEVAAMWKVHEDTVLRHVESGKLKATRLGRFWRFTDEQLNEYLQHRQIDKSKRKKQTA